MERREQCRGVRARGGGQEERRGLAPARARRTKGLRPPPPSLSLSSPRVCLTSLRIPRWRQPLTLPRCQRGSTSGKRVRYGNFKYLMTIHSSLSSQLHVPPHAVCGMPFVQSYANWAVRSDGMPIYVRLQAAAAAATPVSPPRGKWASKMSQVTIMTTNGEGVNIAAPAALTGDYEEDFDRYS